MIELVNTLTVKRQRISIHIHTHTVVSSVGRQATKCAIVR